MKNSEKMKKLIFATLTAVLALAGCREQAHDHLSQYVDPYIGSGGHGHVFVGADTPYGAVKLGPHQPYRGWDWCSGYHYSDSVILGFSHTRLNGTGIGELGDILMMPVTAATPRDEQGRPYTRLDHERETVRPGFYALSTDEGVEAELTAAPRAGFHRYRFPDNRAAVLLDLGAGIGWDSMTSCHVERLDDRRIAGFRRSTGWAKDQFCYFAAEFSAPIASATDEGDNRTLYTFDTEAGELQIKVGISAVSSDNALDNLAADIGSRTFDDVAGAAAAAWDKALAAIEIEPLDEVQQRIFYTALYHTMTAPFIFNDANGQYRGADGQIHSCEGENYTIFSLWDTYRAASPLLTIIDPQRARNVGETMMRIWREQGKLPVWHLAGNETDCMVGNPGVIVMGDLVLKGLADNPQEVLEAMKASSMLDERGMEYLKVYGYIPFDKSAELETVAKGLEFAIADDAVARVAAQLGDRETERYFGHRSKSYRHYFDPETRFMRGRASDGSWRTPFDPFKALHMRSDFTEGNAWQYTWLVPHDIDGLARLLGGRKAFLEKLDEFFVAEGDLGPDANDVTGLIGQYAHGNEPSHHIIYMYNHFGEYDRCARLVRKVMSELYHDLPDGLCGNEDVGQMSAWYVLSSIGLYQAEPAGGVFQIGSPAVKRAAIKVGGGRTFVISAPANSPENIYVAAVKLNGEPLDRRYVTYEEIMAGGTLELEMSDTPAELSHSASPKNTNSEPEIKMPLAFDDLVYDFGRIDEAAGSVSHAFRFENTTDEPLALVRVQTPCNCVTAEIPSAPVQPAQHGTVTVTYNPAYRDGFFSEAVDIIFIKNDRERLARIWVNGTVIPCKHPIEDDHPYALGHGLHTSLKVLMAGGIPQGRERSLVMNYANGTEHDMEVRFEVEGASASALDMPRTLKLGPDERGEMRITYTMPEKALGLQRLTVRPFVNGAAAQPIPFTAVGTPAGADPRAAEKPVAKCSAQSVTVAGDALPQNFDFEVSNTGNAPLRILKVDAPEGVTTTLAAGTVIEAGAKSRFAITAAALPTEPNPRIYAVTNDPVLPYFIISIAAAR